MDTQTSAYFLSGTDTDSGKTTVGEALLLAARRNGETTIGYKPIETGCLDHCGRLLGPDAQKLASAAQHEPLSDFCYRPPIAPSVAARLVGSSISLKAIEDRTSEYRQSADFIVVEGAGGLLVPVSTTQTIADVAELLQLPVIVVAANRLGAMNHCLLTLEVAKQRGLTVTALILNQTNADTQSNLDNAKEISQHKPDPNTRILPFPFCADRTELCNAGHMLLQALRS